MGKFKSPETIKTVIGWMRDNQLLIPAFQRDYVWDYTQVENLFDSLMRDYPINSMLFWRVKGDSKTSYQYYEFLRSYIESHLTHNVPLVGCESKDSFLAVLDGQQRLTSLYLGLCGTFAYHTKYLSKNNNSRSYPPRRLYLNLSKVVQKNMHGDYDEEKKYLFNFLKKEETKNFSEIFVKDNEKWFLVGRILNIDSLLEFSQQNNLTTAESKVLELLQNQICVKENINYYEEDTVAADQAVNIFIRINAGGTYLSMSDILMSILRAGWKCDVRDEIKKLVDEVASNYFYISNDYIIKALLYLESDNIRNLIQNFDNNFLQRTEQNWPSIRKSIVNLFELLHYFKLDHSSLLSYNATLPILYYLYHYTDSDKLTSSISYKNDRENVRTWLFKTLLLKSFSSTSDSVLSNARKPMLDKKHLPSYPSHEISLSIGQPSIIALEQIEELLDVQKDDRRALLILTLLYPNYTDIDVDKDHLHPISMYEEYQLSLGDKALERYYYNSIVNLQLLPASENRSKNATPLKDWLKSYQAANKSIDVRTMSYIPNVDLELNKFNNFYKKRKTILVGKLSQILATN